MHQHSGHPRFHQLTEAEQKLHDEKNHDYAAGGDPLGNFKRVSTIMSLYPGFPVHEPAGVAMMFLMKQLDAVLWGLAKGIKHKVEGHGERLGDISVYAKLTRIILEEAAQELEQLRLSLPIPGAELQRTYKTYDDLWAAKKKSPKVEEACTGQIATPAAPWLPPHQPFESFSNRDAKG